MRHLLVALALLAAVAIVGCKKSQQAASDPRAAAVDAKVQAKWKNSLAGLPTQTLVVLSANNKDIQDEFESAFSLYSAVEYGHKVKIEWRDVGGGGNAMLSYLQNAYSAGGKPEIDIMWGGGDPTFVDLANVGLLEKLSLSESVRANIPPTLAGVPLRDAQDRWCGTCVSAFGFLYSKTLIDKLRLPTPRTWEDLGNPAFLDRVGLADPNISSSAATANEMIVQTGKTWPQGWGRLLAVLGNANRYYSSASKAAEATGVEVVVSTCIDFYGQTRVATNADLVFALPKGQAVFTPDPIGILKNAPHRELAQQFVDFVLSPKGQALWALPLGAEDGPVAKELGRGPIRKDFFDSYKGKTLAWIVNPYAAKGEMKLDMEMKSQRPNVLNKLVLAAMVNNLQLLKQARAKIVQQGLHADLVAKFNELPSNVDTREKVLQTAKDLGNPAKADTIVTDWTEFFQAKYKDILK